MAVATYERSLITTKRLSHSLLKTLWEMFNSADQNSGTKRRKLTKFLRDFILPTYLPCFQHE
jgi:hypothetical protein